MNNDTFRDFIYDGDFSEEKIENIKEYYNASEKQLIRKTFNFLNGEIGVIKDNAFFEEIISNSVEFLCLLCQNCEFNEEEVIINRRRIKKTREALLANANKFYNTSFMDSANRLDEIVLDKNIKLDDLKKLLIKLIDKKEDINIIKKLLNTNKGVILQDKNDLFDYVFDLSVDAIVNNDLYIYYYISLLKIFYTSTINKREYLDRLNAKTDETNQFANEIYLIIFGVKRGLEPDEILDKYGIIKDISTPYFYIPNKEYYDEQIITIDNEGTRLRDDALSIRRENDDYVVGIHIADPTSAIRPNSIEDIIARNNFKVLYLGENSVRILSPEVENRFSLNEAQPREVVSLYAIIDQYGHVKKYYITENVISVTRNFSHDESNDLFDNFDRDFTKPLKDLYDVACLLDQNNPNKKLYWYKKDISSFDKKIRDSKSDKINSELMVLYNKLIATLMCNESVPYVYRIQDPSYIQNLVRKMKIDVDESTQKVIDRIYMDSKYSTTPRFHNGLHIPIYSHSTDPLRRYPDLYNLFLMHGFYFSDMDVPFTQEFFEELVLYFNQRNMELSLMESEYERALKLQRVKK